ncbi:hypothetical protein GIB67_030361 [Kingdonia uniflora]|uniref:LOB domain-containing protein n=1 Tax=Kingdonia uniflora TaxID=39325 RepID=A0A7J7M6X5_9MAGN|nr:hypothetical protein GIB67_030361 [Kingdonia uniflora]
MYSNDTPTPTLSSSPSNSSLPPTPPRLSSVIVTPCAACKILRRRCVEKCVLAPYFPPSEPLKFTTAHRVFGASNIIKMLQELPEAERDDAVSSMVYEASARIRDPVYGCAGAICHLHKQVTELQIQLAKAQAELVNTQQQHANLVALICMEMSDLPQPSFDNYTNISPQSLQTVGNGVLDVDSNLGSVWEPLWT